MIFSTNMNKDRLGITPEGWSFWQRSGGRQYGLGWVTTDDAEISWIEEDFVWAFHDWSMDALEFA